MATSSREFQRAARQRLNTAEFLLEHDYALDAMYLAGYTIECSLKALILNVTPTDNRDDMLKRITSGSKMHEAETLNAILKDLGHPMPHTLVKRFLRSDWTTAMRYEFGRADVGETRAFLKTAKLVYDWVEEQLP